MDREANIVTATERNDAILKECFKRLCPNESYDEFGKKIVRVIDADWSAHELEIECYWDYVARKGNDFRLIPIFLAIAYCIEAQRALKSADFENAETFNTRASYYSEMALNEPMTEAEEHQKIAKAGGQGKSDKYSKPVKEELIRLLKKCPPSGWKNKTVAIRELKGSVWAFIEERKSQPNSKAGLTQTNLSNTLRRWLTHDAEIRDTYEANSFKRLSGNK